LGMLFENSTTRIAIMMIQLGKNPLDYVCQKLEE